MAAVAIYGRQMTIDAFLPLFNSCREWTEYYLSSPRPSILNLISLEISNTSLADMVEAPEIVRKVNMINQIWPKDSTFERYFAVVVEN